MQLFQPVLAYLIFQFLMFRINIYVLIKMILADRAYFQPVRLSWLRVFLSQVRELYCEFYKYRKDSLRELSYTGQRAYLERYLNDRWDFYNRGITVTNEPPYIRLFVATKLEAEPLYIGAHSETPKTFISAHPENNRTVDFIVEVPNYVDNSIVLFDTTAVEATIKKFTQAGKRFEIQVI
jgi:hypothetical protein